MVINFLSFYLFQYFYSMLGVCWCIASFSHLFNCYLKIEGRLFCDSVAFYNLWRNKYVNMWKEIVPSFVSLLFLAVFSPEIEILPRSSNCCQFYLVEIFYGGATKCYLLISTKLSELLHLSETDNTLQLPVLFRCCFFETRVRDFEIVNWYSWFWKYIFPYLFP